MNAKQKIINLLKEKHIDFKSINHASVKTSEEAKNVRKDFSLSQGAKAILIKSKQNKKIKFVLLVLPADKKINSKAVRKILNASSISFASLNEVSEITNGVLPGAIPPFGSIFNLETYCDKDLFLNDFIVFNAGLRTFSIYLKSKDYNDVEKPIICSFTLPIER